MTRASPCEEARSLAPEVALGIASGEERASVLAHVRDCGDCRRLLEGLAETADALLLLAPQEEPSGGFETAALARISGRRRSSRRRLARGIAAAALAAALGGGAVLSITAEDRRLGSRYRAALAEANGKYFGVVPLHDAGDGEVGHLFVYEGSPSWIFFVLDEPLDPGDYAIRIALRAGERIVLDAGELQEGGLEWGSSVPLSLRLVDSIQVVDSSNDVAIEARFPGP
jgi:hypothetical protein